MATAHKRLFRFTFQQTVSITYPVQVISSDSTCCKPFKIAVPHKFHDYLDASENSKPAFPNRRYPPTLSQSIVNQQSHFNTKFHRASSAMTFLVLSLSALQYLTAKQITMPQASVSRLPVSANICQAPLFRHTTEPQVFNISSMWQLNQGHWLSKLDPPGSHANFSQFMATKPDPPRIIPGSHANRLSTLRQLNLVNLRPFRVLMPTFLTSIVFPMATKPRSPLDPPGSHANLSTYYWNLQAWRQAQ